MSDPLPSIPELKTNGHKRKDDDERLTHVPLPGLAVRKAVVGAAGRSRVFKSAAAFLAAKPVLTLGALVLAASAAGIAHFAPGLAGGLRPAASRTGGAFAAAKAGRAGLAQPKRFEPSGAHRSSSLPYVANPNQGAFEPPPSAAPVGGEGNAGKASAQAKEPGASASAQPDLQALSAQLAGPGAAGQASGAAGGGGLKGLMARLGSGFSNLSGGSGMASGVGRGFDSVPFGTARAGRAGGAAPPQAALPSPYGGQVQGFSKQKAPGRIKTASVPVAAGAYRGANLRRLDRMNSAMTPAGGMGNLQQASDIHTQQWSSSQNIGDAGSMAGPAGAGPSAGQTAGAQDNSLQTPVDDSGPIGGGGGNTPATTQPPEVDEGEDVSPWSPIVKLASIIVLLGALINTVVWALRALAVIPALTLMVNQIWLQAMNFIALLSGVVGVIGGLVAMTYGQVGQGALLMVAGGAMLYAWHSPNYMPALISSIIALGSGLIGSFLGKGKDHKIAG